MLHGSKMRSAKALALLFACRVVSRLWPRGRRPPPSPGDGKLAEVVVTGSRVARSTFTTANQVTVLSSKDIESLGLTNVGEVPGELPQLPTTSGWVTSTSVLS